MCGLTWPPRSPENLLGSQTLAKCGDPHPTPARPPQGPVSEEWRVCVTKGQFN